eukprot:scaffold22222_cov20-Prasinocladus_malaysianus.AAC.3
MPCAKWQCVSRSAAGKSAKQWPVDLCGRHINIHWQERSPQQSICSILTQTYLNIADCKPPCRLKFSLSDVCYNIVSVPRWNSQNVYRVPEAITDLESHGRRASGIELDPEMILMLPWTCRCERLDGLSSLEWTSRPLKSLRSCFCACTTWLKILREVCISSTATKPSES